MAEIGYQAFTIEEGGCFFANTILETAHVEDTFLKEVDHFFVQWEKAFTQIFQDSFQGEELLQLTQQVIADIEGSIILMQLRKRPELSKKGL